MRSAAVGLWIGVGSRDERPHLAGAAHFLEHLLFKATPTRTAASLAEEIDALGGELNAFTAKEHTCYYAHVLDSDLGTAIDIVSDVVLNGLCRADDFEVERGVVLEEIAMRDDDPEDVLGEEFATAMFGEFPVGRPVIGSTASITAMRRDQVASFHRRRYTPERMVLSVAGNVDHDTVVDRVRRAFGGHLVPGEKVASPRSLRGSYRGTPTLRLVNRDTEQAHVQVGMRCAGRDNPDRWTMAVLNTAIGGGLSSRLFQRIREERGLAYSVYSAIESFTDVGTFSVYAGCSPDHLGDVIATTREVLADVRDNSITAAEIERSQGVLRGSLILGLEDVTSRMHRNGRNVLDYGKARTLEQSLARIDKVKAADVARVAQSLLSQPVGAAVVGPFRGIRAVPASLRTWVG